jgi:hypothetical protein
MITLSFGVADTAEGIGVFRRLPSGIDAIDLRDAHRLWTSPEKALPIAISGNFVLARLLADDNSMLELIVLDEHDGRVAVRSEPIELPHPITTGAPGFTVRAEGMNGRFRVQWFAPARYAGGAPPPRSILDSQSDARRIFEIDPKSGVVSEAGDLAVAAPQASGSSLQFELTSDYVVIARDTSGAELWRYALGQSSTTSPPLRQ